VSLETTDVTAPDSPCFALAWARTAARGVERTQLDRCANSNPHSIQERIHLHRRCAQVCGALAASFK
jgi:hypothetical protein